MKNYDHQLMIKMPPISHVGVLEDSSKIENNTYF